jgi:Pentapeptide repeats (9 copies)
MTNPEDTPEAHPQLVPAYTKPHYWIAAEGADIWNAWMRSGVDGAWFEARRKKIEDIEGLEEAEKQKLLQSLADFEAMDAVVVFTDAVRQKISANIEKYCGEDTTFPDAAQDIDFSNTEWKIHFDGENVPKYLWNFKLLIFTRNTDFSCATFFTKIFFQKMQFYENANYNNTKFYDYTSFQETLFYRNAYFVNAYFDIDVKFINTVFNEYSIFEDIKFCGLVNFNKVLFNKNTSFKNAQFCDNTDFRKTQFNQSANFENTEFLQYTDFQGTRFCSNTYFESAKFYQHANFRGIQFYEDAHFQKSQFYHYAEFDNSCFFGLTSFSLSCFKDDANFGEVSFAKVPVLSGAKCDGTWIFSKKEQHWPQTGEQTTEIEAQHIEIRYAQLRKRMEELKLHDYELFFHGKELEAKSRNPHETWYKRLLYKAYGRLSDYGQSIAKPLLAVALSMAVFAALYWALIVGYSDFPAGSLPPFKHAVYLAKNYALSFVPTDEVLHGQMFTLDKLCGVDKDALFTTWCGFWFSFATSIQKIFSLLLWFLVALAVRNRLRMR